MPSSSTDVMEIVLRECAASGTQPWFPTEYAQQTGVDRTQMDEAVDELRMANLIEISDWVQGKGQGYIITEFGHEVLEKPRLLNRLRNQGAPPTPARQRHVDAADDGRSWDRGHHIQKALMTPGRPIATFTLIAINVAFFCFGWVQAQQQKVSDSYLFGGGNPRVQIKVLQIRYDQGALWTHSDVQNGRWWRLLTSCFVHHGALHIGMNMFALFILGPLSERMWGKVRFVGLYLLTGVAGSAFAILLREPDQFSLLAGASGAICGLLGAMVPWVLLNRAYLPRELSSSLLRSSLINVVLIGFISYYIPNVSWQGHLGGGIAGAVLAVPFNFSRFGAGLQRPLGWVGVVVISLAFAGYTYAKLTPTAETRIQMALIASSDNATTFHKQLRNWANRSFRGEEIEATELQELRNQLSVELQQLKRTEKILEDAGEFDDERYTAALALSSTYLEKLHTYYTNVEQFLEQKKVTNANWQPVVASHTAKTRAWNAVAESVLFERKN